MPYRVYDRAVRGQVYASVWLEWHVDCGYLDCSCHATVAALGDAETIKQAEKCAEDEDDCKGWRKVKGYWYCPEHAGLTT